MPVMAPFKPRTPMSNPIRTWRTLRGLSLQQLADAAGTSKSQIDKLERGERRLTVDWMVRLARALACDPRDLIPGTSHDEGSRTSPLRQGRVRFFTQGAKGHPSRAATIRPDFNAPARTRKSKSPDLLRKPPSFANESASLHLHAHLSPLPVLAAARGGRDQEMFLTDGPIDQIPRPAYLAHVKDAYAMYVTGDSMVPMYRPRQMLFIHPYKPPVQGSGIVIVKKNGAVLVKEFVEYKQTKNHPPLEAPLRSASFGWSGDKSPEAALQRRRRGSKSLRDFGEGSKSSSRGCVVVREYRPRPRTFAIPLKDIEKIHAVAGTTEPQ